MIEFHAAYFFGLLGWALAAACAWLLACRLARVWSNLGLRYGGAMAVAWVPALVEPRGLTIYSVVATLLCNAVTGYAAVYLTTGADSRAQKPRPPSVPAA